MIIDHTFTGQILELKAKELGRKYRDLKDCSPSRERELERSLTKIGQVHPVSVALEKPGQWQLIDGFKRVHVLEKISGGETLVRAQKLAGGPRSWLSAMLLLNWGQRTVTLLEEGLVLQALEQEGLTQTRMGALLKRDKSWVSRRLSLVKRLEESVLDHLKSGLIHAGTARTLAMLPRGNQGLVLEAILEHRLNMRDQEALLQELSRQSEQKLTKSSLERALKKQREAPKSRKRESKQPPLREGSRRCATPAAWPRKRQQIGRKNSRHQASSTVCTKKPWRLPKSASKPSICYSKEKKHEEGKRNDIVENEWVSRYGSGDSIRGLAERFGLSRNTVRRILRKRECHRQEEEAEPLKEKKRLARARKTDPFRSDIIRMLERYPKLSAVRIYEDIRARGYEGNSTQVRQLVHELRPRPKCEPTVRFEVEPGQQGQMDWSFYKVRFLKGGVREVCCFGYVLKYSRRLFIDFCERRNYPNMIWRHQEAFAYFGGVPRECLYDGEKTVLLRWEAGRPVYNPKFVAFLTHYGCRPVGCRPGRPQTKGAIEASFRYVENNLLAGRTFYDLADLRSYTREWLCEKADARLWGQQNLSVGECFAQVEAPELLALPARAYDRSEVVLRVGALDGYVQFETNVDSLT